MENVYYDYKTKNKSFIEMHRLLNVFHVKNNKFMLALNNKDLLGVDPYDKKLDRDTKIAIMKECKDNIWYYLREVVRFDTVPDHKFMLNPVSLSIAYCYDRIISLYINACRQRFKTHTIAACNSWQDGIDPDHVSSESTVAELECQLTKTLPDYMRLFSNDHKPKSRKLFEEAEFNITDKEDSDLMTYLHGEFDLLGSKDKDSKNSSMLVMDSTIVQNCDRLSTSWVRLHSNIGEWWKLFDMDPESFIHNPVYIKIDADDCGLDDGYKQSVADCMVNMRCKRYDEEVAMIRYSDRISVNAKYTSGGMVDLDIIEDGRCTDSFKIKADFDWKNILVLVYDSENLLVRYEIVKESKYYGFLKHTKAEGCTVTIIGWVTDLISDLKL